MDFIILNNEKLKEAENGIYRSSKDNSCNLKDI
jgi:hypothetical protein